MQNQSKGHTNLWLVQTPHQFFFIEEDVLTGTIIRFEQKDKLEKSMESTTGFQQIKAFIVPSSFTLLPSALFLEEHKEEYLTFTTQLRQDEMVKVDTIPYHKTKIIWSLNEKEKNNIINAFPGSVFHCLFKPLIESVERFDGKNKILSLFLGEVLLFVVIKNGALQVVNYFETQSVEDVLYYHLLMLQSLDEDEDKVNLIPLGISPLKLEFLQRAEDYFSQIHNSGLTDEQELFQSIKV